MFEHVHHVAYAVEDMDEGIAVFEKTFELELLDRRVVEGELSFEMATFRCGPTFIELQRPINFPKLEQYLKDNGPGLTHVGFAVKNLPERIDQLKSKGVKMKEPGAFVAGTGWRIANFDMSKCQLPIFESKYHDDHLAEVSDTE